MSKICCLLDACTVINLIHIDENDFLLKKLDKLDIQINELVFSEVTKNVYTRINDSRQNLPDIRENIDKKLSFFRGKKNCNIDIQNDLGVGYFEKIKKLTNYPKGNGELYSVAFALYLSRKDSKKVFFYTDDSPAKREFSIFFELQQIGQIKDTVDLLILLYWLDDSFLQKDLIRFLSNLYAEYASDVTKLQSALRKYDESISATTVRQHKNIKPELKELINKLNGLNFKGINTIRESFSNKKGAYKEIKNILDKYPSVFELENNNEKILLQKIELIQNELHSIQKLLDLCND